MREKEQINILIVDDEESIVEFIKMGLEAEGYSAHTTIASNRARLQAGNTTQSSNANISKTKTSPKSTTGKTVPSTKSPSSAVNSKYKDGTYTGIANGYRSNLTVSVNINKDKITSVDVLSINDNHT